MRYRVILTNPILGAVTLSKLPKGLDAITPTLRRGESHGVTEEIDIKLEFYCGAGKEFIDQVRDEQGIDGEILIDINAICGCENDDEVSEDYSIDYSVDYGSTVLACGGYDSFYEGVLDLKTYEKTDNTSKVEINPRGILQTVKNRLDTKVDLFALETLDGTAVTPFTYGPYDLTLHSKEIIKTTVFNPLDPVSGFIAYDYSDDVVAILPIYPEIDEIGGGNNPAPSIVNVNSDSPDYNFINPDQVRNYVIDYNLQGSVTADGTLHPQFDLFIELRLVNDGDIFQIPAWSTRLQDFGLMTGPITRTINATGQISIPLQANMKAYVTMYFDELNVSASPDNFTISNLSLTEDSYVKFSASTTTEESIGKGIAVFEAGAQIARVITDQVDSFRSSYFGRTNSQPFAYVADGCGSKRSFMSGFLARGFPLSGDNARTTRMSMNDYFKGLNAIDNLGMSVEKVGDDYFVVIERKEYFYDATIVLLTLNNVPDLKFTEAPECYYNRIEIGFEEWETEFSNGLDEFNSKRQFDTGIKAVDNPLNQYSNLVASGYRLESARRMQFSDFFTEDSEFDEDVFVICLNKGDLTVAEKNENFTDVNNVISPETAYNLDISPERNFLRWNNVINAGLTKYPGREVKFTSGEGNYKIESQYSDNYCPGAFNNEMLSGGQNLQWDDPNNLDQDPIWLPEFIEFEFPLKWSEYQTIKANPKGVISVSSGTTDHVKGFIIDLKYKPNGVSNFKLLRAFE